MTAADRLAALDRRLADLRTDERRRRLALAAAGLVGLGLAWLHWTGLVLGGALVGLTRTSVPRAVVSGAAFGGLVTLLGVVLTPTLGFVEFASLHVLGGATAAVGVVAPVWGSLLRAAT